MSTTTLSIVSAAIWITACVVALVALAVIVAARRRSEALLADAEKVRDRALELVEQAEDLAAEFSR